MAETATAPPAAPSAGTQSPSETPAEPRSVGVSPETAKEASKGFGGQAEPAYVDAPVLESTEESADPGQGHPAEPSTGSSESAPVLEQTPLPGDDIIAELDKFGKILEPVQTETPALPNSDEDFAKAIDPDGKATPEQRIQNAQSLIGKWSKEIGETRKKQAAYDQAIEGLKPFFRFDDKGQPWPTPEGVVRLADALPFEELSAVLAERGQKIVSLDFSGNGDDPDYLKDAGEIANQLLPDVKGQEMTLEEKLAEIEADTGLKGKKRLFDRELARRDAARQGKKESTQRQREMQEQQSVQERYTKLQSFWDDLSKLPHFNDIKDHVLTENKWLGDGALPVDKRNRVLRILGEFHRFPTVLKTVRDQAFKMGQEDVRKKNGLTMPEGEVQMVVTGKPEPQGGGVSAATQKAAQKAFGI